MHAGFVNYTIGQRNGLGIALGHPAYVTHIDAVTNRVTLGTNDDMYATELHFRPVLKPRLLDTATYPLFAKVRYRTTPVEATLKNESCLEFATPVWGVTPGQSVVLYQDGLVVGGGFIL